MTLEELLDGYRSYELGLIALTSERERVIKELDQRISEQLSQAKELGRKVWEFTSEIPIELLLEYLPETARPKIVPVCPAQQANEPKADDLVLLVPPQVPNVGILIWATRFASSTRPILLRREDGSIIKQLFPFWPGSYHSYVDKSNFNCLLARICEEEKINFVLYRDESRDEQEWRDVFGVPTEFTVLCINNHPAALGKAVRYFTPYPAVKDNIILIG